MSILIQRVPMQVLFLNSKNVFSDTKSYLFSRRTFHHTQLHESLGILEFLAVDTPANILISIKLATAAWRVIINVSGYFKIATSVMGLVREGVEAA